MSVVVVVHVQCSKTVQSPGTVHDREPFHAYNKDSTTFGLPSFVILRQESNILFTFFFINHAMTCDRRVFQLL